MNKKEKQILEDLELYKEDNNYEGCKRFFNDESHFIDNPKRTSEFFNKVDEIKEWLFTPFINSISYETNEYYRQENKISDDPEIY